MPTDKLLELEGLTKYFYKPMGLLGRRKQVVQSVDHVSFHILRHETFGLVGESGCGKSTLGRTITRLYEPTEGKILYDGTDISHLTGPQLLPYRKRIQMIFQDPQSSLDPRQQVKDIIMEPMLFHKIAASRKEAEERCLALLERVGLNSEHANRYPHEFSGGQQQRVGIARALAVKPEFIVCDEPISALDVSIQSQVVNMLEDMQQELGLTYLFIAHDLSVVRHISNRIGVMYLGSLVELAESYELNKNPLHPYTKTLLSAVPVPDPEVSRQRQRIVLEGDIPSPMHPPKGCRFHTRCPYATDKCKEAVPEFKEHAPGHWAACHLLG